MNVLNVHSTITGDYSRGETPVLIPNTEVKTFSADDTCREADWKNRTLPVFKKFRSTHHSVLFLLSYDLFTYFVQYVDNFSFAFTLISVCILLCKL